MQVPGGWLSGVLRRQTLSLAVRGLLHCRGVCCSGRAAAAAADEDQDGPRPEAWCYSLLGVAGEEQLVVAPAMAITSLAKGEDNQERTLQPGFGPRRSLLFTLQPGQDVLASIPSIPEQDSIHLSTGSRKQPCLEVRP